MYKTRKSKRLIINNRQFNVNTVTDKDPSSDKTKTIPSTTKSFERTIGNPIP